MTQVASIDIDRSPNPAGSFYTNKIVHVRIKGIATGGDLLRAGPKYRWGLRHKSDVPHICSVISRH
jgi:hypothetical protein